MKQVGDMIVSLYNLPKIENKSKVEISRLFISNIDELMAFMEAEFPDKKGWRREVFYAAHQSPIKVFIAKYNGEIIGFACYDSSAKGFFGPFGVKASCRKKGVGTKLFLATLEDMKANGYGYAIIGWVDEAKDFYKKVAGAEFIKNGTPNNSVYSNKINLNF